MPFKTLNLWWQMPHKKAPCPRPDFTLCILCLIVILILPACNLIEESPEESGVVIASVDDNKLYLKDIRSLFGQDISAEDSTQFLNQYKMSWIRKELLLKTASEMYKDNPQIKKLVSEYKASLMLDYYKKHLIQTDLDSTISPEEYKAVYEHETDNFVAAEEFYNVKLIIISKQHPLLDLFLKRWEDRAISAEELDSICLMGTTQCWLKDDLWLNYASISNLINSDELEQDQLEDEGPITLTEGDNKIFIYVEDMVAEGETLPLPLVKAQVKRIILNKRREELLKTTSDDLYQEALREGRVKLNL